MFFLNAAGFIVVFAMLVIVATKFPRYMNYTPLGVGLVLLILTVFSVLNTMKISNEWIVGNAKVTEYKEGMSSAGRRTKEYITLLLNLDEHTKVFVTIEARQIDYPLGKEVQMIFPKGEPSKAMFYRTNWNTSIGFIFATLVFLVIGGNIVRTIRKTENMKKKLLTHGQEIMADITATSAEKSLKIDGKHGYIIKAEWQDRYNNNWYSFVSERIWINPDNYLDGKKQIKVFIQPDDPENYYMDASFIPEKYRY